MYIKRDDEKPLHDTYSTLIYAIYIVPYRSYVKVLEDHTDHSQDFKALQVLDHTLLAHAMMDHVLKRSSIRFVNIAKDGIDQKRNRPNKEEEKRIQNPYL